jgi:plasmid stabilization system protein ParE
MPKQVIWSPQSEDDFSNILEYLKEHWDKKVVLKFIDIVDEIINHISINPKQYPIIQKRKKIRKCVTKTLRRRNVS